MKPFILLLFAVLIYSSCDKAKHETTYTYHFQLQGDTESNFSKSGESRRFTLSVLRKCFTDGIISGATEKVTTSAISLIPMENDLFTVENIQKNDGEYIFDLSIPENDTDTLRKDMLKIVFTEGETHLTHTFQFQQNPSDINTAYEIQTNMPQPFHIPAEGGIFEIPFTCMHIKYINGNLSQTIPGPLKGLKYFICIANSGSVHSLFIQKDGELAGQYKFKIEAQGPYNLNYWSKTESTFFVEIKNDKKVIFHRDIIHPQTENEEYTHYSVTIANHSTFDI